MEWEGYGKFEVWGDAMLLLTIYTFMTRYGCVMYCLDEVRAVLATNGISSIGFHHLRGPPRGKSREGRKGSVVACDEYALLSAMWRAMDTNFVMDRGYMCQNLNP